MTDKAAEVPQRSKTQKVSGAVLVKDAFAREAKRKASSSGELVIVADEQIVAAMASEYKRRTDFPADVALRPDIRAGRVDGTEVYDAAWLPLALRFGSLPLAAEFIGENKINMYRWARGKRIMTESVVRKVRALFLAIGYPSPV